MKHTVKINFGSEQVIKAYYDAALNQDERNTNV